MNVDGRSERAHRAASKFDHVASKFLFGIRDTLARRLTGAAVNLLHIRQRGPSRSTKDSCFLSAIRIGIIGVIRMSAETSGEGGAEGGDMFEWAVRRGSQYDRLTRLSAGRDSSFRACPLIRSSLSFPVISSSATTCRCLK